MFAFIGIIIPILVVVDYYMERLSIDETVTNKYVVPMSSSIKYYIYTDKQQILTKNDLYDNLNVGDRVSFKLTSIFNTVTNVSYTANNSIRNYKLDSVYGWPLIIVLATFVTSFIVVYKTWGLKRKRGIKSNLTTNIGVVNAFLCLMTLVVVLFKLL